MTTIFDAGNQGTFIFALRDKERAGTLVSPRIFATLNGDTFGLYGIEIDAATSDSPAETYVLAAIPDVFGPGRTAQMTYYETAGGAKVFAAGALNFGGSVLPVGRVKDERLSRLIANIWDRLSQP